LAMAVVSMFVSRSSPSNWSMSQYLCVYETALWCNYLVVLCPQQNAEWGRANREWEHLTVKLQFLSV
jgi:hypothetical protein